MTAPVLGMMLGDYTGIGPEQCARVLADKRLADAARLLVVGDSRVLGQGARDAGVTLEWRAYATPEEVDWSREETPIIDLQNLDPSIGFPRGVVSPQSGRIAGETLAYMIGLALEGRLDGDTQRRVIHGRSLARAQAWTGGLSAASRRVRRRSAAASSRGCRWPSVR